MLNFEVNDCEIVEAVQQTKHWLRLLLHQNVYMSLNKKNTPNYDRIISSFAERDSPEQAPS